MSSLPIRIRVLLAAVIAAPDAAGFGRDARRRRACAHPDSYAVRELAIGLMLSFAAAIVVGAVMTAGSVIGGSMELNSGAILRATSNRPISLSDGFGALAALLFFVGGFHRMLMPRSRIAWRLLRWDALASGSAHLIELGGRIFALALGLTFPVLVPLFVLSIAQGVIARLAPQVNILIAAPAAIVIAGLICWVSMRPDSAPASCGSGPA